MSFVKLYGSILDSSVWGLPAATRLVWITMLAMADQDGIVSASVDGLARRAVVGIDEAKTALETFLGPDPYSRDGTSGERIEAVPGGWLILNHAQYRERRTDAQIATAARVKKHREHRPLHSVTCNNVTPCNTQKQSTDADAEAYAEPRKRKRTSSAAPMDALFLEFWKAYPNRVGKGHAERAWSRLSDEEKKSALESVPKQIAHRGALERVKGAFVPHWKHPATWLKARCWEDELPEPPREKTLEEWVEIVRERNVAEGRI